MGEREDQIGRNLEPVSESQKLAEVYKPSSLERAFQVQLQERFQTKLLEPFIDEHGNLVRVSSPTVVNDQLVAFQYTRLDPSKSFNIFNIPIINVPIGFMELIMEIEDETHKSIDFDPDVADEQIRQIIRERDGDFNQIKALTDPNYYTKNTTIVHWPEEFAFVLVKTENKEIKPLMAKIMKDMELFSAREECTYGRLQASARFNFDESHEYGNLKIEIPNKLAEPYRQIFRKDWSPRYLTYSENILLESPKKTAVKLVSLVSKLAKIK